MAIKYSFKKQCNVCTLGDCMCDRIWPHHIWNYREPGDHPDNCIPPTKQDTWCEANNVDINVTDVAEKIYEFRDRVDKGGFTPDGKRWVPAMSERERRAAYINYGLLKPKA